MPSRSAAQAAISAGRVIVGGAPARNAARLVAPSDAVVLQGAPPRFVSRGGAKLHAAIHGFALRTPVAGARCLDAGASTGGFTDCLLQHGAARVTAVDVGYGQLADRLRRDARVASLERTNVRHLHLEEPVDIVVGDLSFIGLAAVAPALADRNVRAGGDVVVLVKPQFEAGRAEASKARGVIRDPIVWRRVLGDARSTFAAVGAAMMDVMVSPIRGADGNVEFLAHIWPHAAQGGVLDDARLDAVVAEAEASGR